MSKDDHLSEFYALLDQGTFHLGPSVFNGMPCPNGWWLPMDSTIPDPLDYPGGPLIVADANNKGSQA